MARYEITVSMITRRRLLLPALIVIATGTFATTHSQERPGDGSYRPVPSNTVHNLFRIGDKVYCGSGPESYDDFRFLASLGIKTIVSVDGAVPDVDTARELGLRYVHLPLKYSEMSPADVQGLAGVLANVAGPIYVHCHHGKHRGPAATAIICQQSGLLSKDQSLEFLAAAGTGKQYQGLWKSVREFAPVKLSNEMPKLPERVEPQGLQAAMVRIDGQFESLKKALASGNLVSFRAVVESHGPELQEEFQESARLGTDDADLRRLLNESAAIVERLTNVEKLQQAGEFLKDLEQRCSACHAQYRL